MVTYAIACGQRTPSGLCSLLLPHGSWELNSHRQSALAASIVTAQPSCQAWVRDFAPQVWRCLLSQTDSASPVSLRGHFLECHLQEDFTLGCGCGKTLIQSLVLCSHSCHVFTLLMQLDFRIRTFFLALNSTYIRASHSLLPALKGNKTLNITLKTVWPELVTCSAF